MGYKFKQPIKEKRPVVATRETIKVVYRFLVNYIATAVIGVAFFVHFFLPAAEPEVTSAKKEFQSVGDDIESHKDSIVQLAYAFNPLNASFFTGETQRHRTTISSLTALQAEKERAYQVIKEEKKVWGYPSRHKFLWAFGLGLIITALSLRIMHYSHSINEKEKRWANSLFGVIGGMIGFYMFAWIFYPDNDLPYSHYMTIIISIGLLSSILGYFLSRIRFHKFSRLKAIIHRFFGFVYEDLEEKKVIRPEKETEFTKMRVELTEEVVG